MDKNIYLMTFLYTIISVMVLSGIKYYFNLGLNWFELAVYAIIIALGFYMSQKYLPACSSQKKKK
jgi:hypothetical protein